MNNSREFNFPFIKRDFNKSIYLLAEIIGIALLLLGTYYFINQEYNEISDHWAVILPVGFGLSLLLFATIYHFGEAYTTVNDTHIIYKPYIYRKEQYIKWDDVMLVRTRLQSIEFITKTNNVFRIDMSKTNYEVTEELEDFVYAMAEEKSISTYRYVEENPRDHDTAVTEMYFDTRAKIKSYSMFNAVFGLFIIFTSTTMIIVQENKTTLDIAFIVLMYVYGAYALIHSILHEKRKSYFAVNSDRIAVKSKELNREENLYWDSVQAISVQSNKINVQLIDGSVKMIDLATINYNPKQNIEDFMISAAKLKSIYKE